jgi:HEPN domain-containing protein
MVMQMKVSRTRWLIAGAALLIIGCGNAQRDATEGAINAAQSAINAVRAEAEKYVPDQLRGAERTLQSARDSLAKGDYGAALAKAREAANKARDMAVAAAGTKEEWRKNWNELNESLPKSMDQIKNRIDAYSHGARMPEGMDKEVLEEAKKEYADLKEKWEKAKEYARQGQLGDAIQKTTGLNEAIAKLKAALRIKQ